MADSHIMEDNSLSGLAKEVGKHIVADVLLPPLKRHFDYYWSCPDNIQSLRDEVRRHFKIARGDMDQNIEEARYRAESATAGSRERREKERKREEDEGSENTEDVEDQI